MRMAFKEDLQQKLDSVNQNINKFFSFITNKLKNYKNLTLGEQISFPTVGLGFILILISIILFVV